MRILFKIRYLILGRMSYCSHKDYLSVLLDVEKEVEDGLVDVFVPVVKGREEDVVNKGDVEVTVVEVSFSLREGKCSIISNFSDKKKMQANGLQSNTHTNDLTVYK